MYTVDQVAEILHLHPRTVRRFIREGKLKARKAGKQWRVMEEDVNLFLGDKSGGTDGETVLTGLGDGEEIPAEKQILVSSVVDVYGTNKDNAIRIANALFAALNCKNPADGEARCDHIYFEEENKARFILWGGIKVVKDLLACIAKISE